MSKRNRTLRVYLSDQGEIRYFYWIKIGNDQSVYYGSGLKDIRRMSHRDFRRTPGGTKLELDHKKLDPVEVAGKHSLHRSGILLMKNTPGGRRIRRTTQQLHEYFIAIPLVGVMPMSPLVYSRTAKTLRNEDIVLPTEPLEGKPFAFLLYLQPIGIPRSNILSQYRKIGCCVERQSNIGSFAVHAAIYRDPNTFLTWSASQVEAIARDSGVPPRLQFPLFGKQSRNPVT